VAHGRTEAGEAAPWPRAMAPVSGDPRRWGGSKTKAKATQRGAGDPFGGSGEEGCSPVSPSAVARSVEGNGGGRGRPRAEGAGEVDGEVHGAAADHQEVETGRRMAGVTRPCGGARQ
jgi:hypothetical protein